MHGILANSVAAELTNLERLLDAQLFQSDILHDRMENTTAPVLWIMRIKRSKKLCQQWNHFVISQV